MMWDWLKWLTEAPAGKEQPDEHPHEPLEIKRPRIWVRTPNWRAPHTLVPTQPKPPRKAKHA